MGVTLTAAAETSGGRFRSLEGAEVVVGYDGAGPSENAVRWAATEAERLGSPLTVVYAADVPAGRAWPLKGLATARDLDAVSVRMARKGSTIASAGHPDLAVRPVGVVGVAAGELIARSAQAGLVVVGRRRPRLVDTGEMGSVSFAVAMHSRCPVVVVPEGVDRHPGAGRPVVVGVDGSRAAWTALEAASSLAIAWEAPLRVVSAWQHPHREPWSLAFDGGEAVAEVARMAEEAAADITDEAVARARAAMPGLDVWAEVEEGPAAEVLADASRDAGIVVVGSRGQGGFAGLAMGSVSLAVVRRAVGPVAVVRHGSF